jgi:hypothetical protein
MNRAILLAFCLFFPLPAAAQLYFGEFGVGPSGEFRDGDPWQEFVLDKEFEFLDPNGLRWATPSGAAVNGASIPPIFWSLIGGPFTGKYLKASVIHDYYVVNRTRTAHDTHRNFYYGMRANGVSSWQAKTMYWAVRTFGADWDLYQPVAKQGGQASSIHISGNFDSQQYSAAIARQSLLEVARNLKTSDGETLRMVFGGPVEATLDAIDDDAFATQRTLAIYTPLLINDSNSDFKTVLFNFSWLADSKDLTLETLPKWPDGRIPPSGGTVAQDFRDVFPTDELRDLEFNFEVPG